MKTIKSLIVFLFIASSLMAQSLGGDVYFKKDLWKLLTSTTLSPISSTYGTSALFSSLTDGTDTFKMLTSSDKWTLQNDAVSPANLVTVDSVGAVSANSFIVPNTSTTSSVAYGLMGAGTGLYSESVNYIRFVVNTKKSLTISVSDQVVFGSPTVVGWDSGDPSTVGTGWKRIDTGVIAQVNGTNPQQYRLYNQDATGSNDRYMSLGWSADSVYSSTQVISGGKTARPFKFVGSSSYTTDAQTGNSVQQTITLGAGATTLAVTKNVITVTGDGGANTLATLTGAVVGTYVFIFTDGLVTITDTDAHTANTVDLAGTATNFTSADDKTLTLVYDGTSFYQISTSTN